MNKKKRKEVAQAENISEAIKTKPKIKIEKEDKKGVDLIGLAKELAKRRSEKEEEPEKVDL